MVNARKESITDVMHVRVKLVLQTILSASQGRSGDFFMLHDRRPDAYCSAQEVALDGYQYFFVFAGGTHRTPRSRLFGVRSGPTALVLFLALDCF